jgi:hypothetical protein
MSCEEDMRRTTNGSVLRRRYDVGSVTGSESGGGRNAMDHTLDPDQALAVYLAVRVREAMEDFHVTNLTDEQMAVINPLIRNALYGGLRIRRLAASGDLGCQRFIERDLQAVPPYWEPPQLNDSDARVINGEYPA